jgi:hypothetical protein
MNTTDVEQLIARAATWREAQRSYEARRAWETASDRAAYAHLALQVAHAELAARREAAHGPRR